MTDILKFLAENARLSRVGFQRLFRNPQLQLPLACNPHLDDGWFNEMVDVCGIDALLAVLQFKTLDAQGVDRLLLKKPRASVAKALANTQELNVEQLGQLFTWKWPDNVYKTYVEADVHDKGLLAAITPKDLWTYRGHIMNWWAHEQAPLPQSLFDKHVARANGTSVEHRLHFFWHRPETRTYVNPNDRRWAEAVLACPRTFQDLEVGGFKTAVQASDLHVRISMARNLYLGIDDLHGLFGRREDVIDPVTRKKKRGVGYDLAIELRELHGLAESLEPGWVEDPDTRKRVWDYLTSLSGWGSVDALIVGELFEHKAPNDDESEEINQKIRISEDPCRAHLRDLLPPVTLKKAPEREENLVYDWGGADWRSTFRIPSSYSYSWKKKDAGHACDWLARQLGDDTDAWDVLVALADTHEGTFKDLADVCRTVTA